MASTHSQHSMLQSLGDDDEQITQKLEEFMSNLQEERVKIEAFKRELPLCMHLLTNAMEESKKQLQSCKLDTTQLPDPTPPPPPPVLEQFIPILINNNSSTNINVSNEKEKEKVDKSHWMTSVQLWNPTSATCNNPVVDDVETNNNYGPKVQKRPSPPPPPEIKCSDSSDSDIGVRRENSNNSCRMMMMTMNQNQHHQPNRKTRRCWSPDLHRRFLNALQMLGGSEVATPKQIRELMKVDGLTNDEVKSHLQKYRLHTRRPGPSSMAGADAPPTQLVVVGGIWVPPPPPPMIYGPHPTDHHHAVLHSSNPTGPQQLYTHHHHQLMHQFHVYNPSSSSSHQYDSDVKSPAKDGREVG